MDQAVILYYRHLLREEFPNSGEIEHPSVLMEAIGQKMIDCGNTGNYMQLYFQVEDDRVSDIKYLCSCEPVANVGVEVLCELVKGLTLQEAFELNEDVFYQHLGSHSREYVKKVKGLLELLRDGIEKYYIQSGQTSQFISNPAPPSEKITWDGTLSPLNQ